MRVATFCAVDTYAVFNRVTDYIEKAVNYTCKTLKERSLKEIRALGILYTRL